ncbi:hypothetical protein PHOBOS_219 [Erwinia phage vB_EamM_Phobos]|uniref:hypothetical protein n=1 Tax=Erwinia phage vB_EamM_Phobos TaxID=1883377 RepID=UPI00081C92DA|nr:hypothetical protein BIZ79_gp219 [Erwinia phage vB_EamM_Phobos]ANZ50409.1 hypothetical protein PHOBOS_219 [Erwinia phage vB_EamM_Phobos]
MLKRMLIVLALSVAYFSFPAHALTFKEAAEWPEPIRPTFSTVVGMGDNKVVMHSGDFMLIRAFAGDACPAGQYFLANLANKTIESVNIGTCDEEELTFGTQSPTVKHAGKSIDVYSHGELIARMPVY